MFTNIKNTIKQKISRYYYKYLVAKVEKPQFQHHQLTTEGYFSQFGQVKWIFERLSRNKENKFYVDIGANDGITLSNTYFLEKNGWDGIAVKPIPSVYEKLNLEKTLSSYRWRSTATDVEWLSR